jgi:uncharacterized protein (DUF1697 family)
MHTWVALLRGINVGGKHIVPMKQLAQLMLQIACVDPKTYIQSGNVVFKHAEANPKEISRLLSELILQHFTFQPKVMIFPASDFSLFLSTNPFKAVYSEAKHVHLFFFEQAPLNPNLTGLAQLKAPSEQFELQLKAFYLYAPEGVGRSKLAEKVEKYLGVSTTARNLNTVLKLNELVNAK